MECQLGLTGFFLEELQFFTLGFGFVLEVFLQADCIPVLQLYRIYKIQI